MIFLESLGARSILKYFLCNTLARHHAKSTYSMDFILEDRKRNALVSPRVQADGCAPKREYSKLLKFGNHLFRGG